MTGLRALALAQVAAGCATVVVGGRTVRAGRGAEARSRLRGEAPAPGAPPWFAAVLARVDVAVEPGRLWPSVRRGAVVAGAALVWWAPVLVAVAAMALVAGALVGPVLARARAAQAFTADLPVAVDAVVALLASGSSLVQAFGGAATRPGPVAADLAVVVARQRQGASLQVALDRWAESRPGVGVGLVADALALAGTSGGSQARALAGVGATLRERAALAREIRALAAQVRASAVVLVATPLGFALVVAAVDQRIREVLVATPLGWACLVGGAALDGAGAWWMARLVGSVR